MKEIFVRKIFMDKLSGKVIRRTAIRKVEIDSIREFFDYLQSVHGRCVESLYIGAGDYPVGWVFEKMDERDNRVKETHVTLHTKKSTRREINRHNESVAITIHHYMNIR